MNLNKKILLVAVVFSAGLPAPLEAKDKAVRPSGQTNCHMVKTAQMGISFSNVSVEFKSMQSYVDQQAIRVMNIAGDLGIDDIFVQNMSYNIYSSNNGGCNAQSSGEYRMNGNVSFQILDAKKAVSLMEKVDEAGYIVTFNMNSYRQCQ